MKELEGGDSWCGVRLPVEGDHSWIQEEKRKVAVGSKQQWKYSAVRKTMIVNRKQHDEKLAARTYSWSSKHWTNCKSNTRF